MKLDLLNSASIQPRTSNLKFGLPAALSPAPDPHPWVKYAAVLTVEVGGHVRHHDHLLLLPPWRKSLLERPNTTEVLRTLTPLALLWARAPRTYVCSNFVL